MTDNLRVSEPLEPGSRLSIGPRSVFRRIVLPLLVIGAIVAAIWWLESRGGDDVSPTGERYGPVELPTALQTTGLEIGVQEGNLAPDFLLGTLDGSEVRLSALRGQPVVLNFWATWCAPCRQEIPQFVAAYERFRNESLLVLAVNMQEGKSIARGYAEDFGMKFPIPIDVDGEVGDEYRLLGLPMTYFIDRGGVVRSVFTGPLPDRRSDKDPRGAIEQNGLAQRVAQIHGRCAPAMEQP